MKVLIGCERSAVVRQEFERRGHDAWSCDIVESEAAGNHIVADVREVMRRPGWDLFIVHPECTFLTVANTYLRRGCSKYTAAEAKVLQRQAVEFFLEVAESGIPKSCTENPIGIMSRIYRPPDQIIQPYQFGDDASKATCLWLRGLQLLMPTRFVEPRYSCRCGMVFEYALGKYGCPSCSGDHGAARPFWGNQTQSGQNRLGPSANRSAMRARTYQGIAAAMAEQWG